MALLFCRNALFPQLRLFIPFLLIIILYEYGTLQGSFTVNGSNHWAANMVTLFEFVFYSFMIRSFLTNKINKRYLLSAALVIVALSILNIAFIQGFWKLHSYTLSLGSIVIISFVCVYFYELLHYDLEKLSISKYPIFWIATGILFFYLGEFLFFAFFSYMAYRDDYSYFKLFKIISNASNVILYSCLSIAFVCNRWIKT